MTEQITDVDERDGQQAKLSDLDEAEALPAGKTNKRSGKRVLLAAFALLLLIGVAGTGGYYLLRGKQVNLKADKRMPEKASSGADIRKAAYDSISDSLTAQPPTTSPAGGGNQTGPVSAEMNSGEKVSAPIQSGIAETLAPPPEALTAKPAPTPVVNGERTEPTNLLKPSATSATSLSLRFASAAPPERNVPALKSTGGKETGVKPQTDDRPKLAGVLSSQPSFGAMLPVRLMGALYTLRAGSMARFELMRDLKADRWQMRRGTVFIGSVIGGDVDRAYVQIKGYLDPETERLVKIEGELLGDDGGAGLRGRQRRVSPVWVKVLDRAAQAGVQIATGILNSRASSVIIATDPYGAIRSPGESQSQHNRSFVEVPAGAVGFVMVTRLPEAEKEDSHLAAARQGNNDFADRDLAELITTADPARIRAALPEMNAELRRIAELVIKEIEAAGK
jgi:hypothetical protein